MKKIIITFCIVFILFTSFIIFLLSVSDDPDGDPPVKKQKITYNFILLIDLSNRVSAKKFSDQVEKDLSLLDQIFNFFEKKIASDLYIYAQDSMKITILPNNAASSMSSELDFTIDYSQIGIHNKRDYFSQKKKLIQSELNKIYQDASKKVYLSADIWKFFKEDLSYYLKKSNPNTQNFLFIITDGYMYSKTNICSKQNRYTYILSRNLSKFRNNNEWEKLFDSNDYAFLSVNKKFSSLNVLLLEVKPLEFFYNEFDIMKKFWSKWFKEMDIQQFEILKCFDNMNRETYYKNIEAFIYGKYERNENNK